jgi:triacylglycerol lipase
MKELPNPRGRDLVPPDMDYVYFEESDSHPMEPENQEYSEVNAWWFAECAFLAYCHPGFARMAYRLAGFDGFRFFESTGTECMVSWNEQVAVVAFRGTELKSLSALHEIRTDLNAAPVPFELGGKVHRGFLDGLGEIWDGPEGLQALLATLIKEQPDRPLWMTGHSLGGALAALCFARTPQAKGLYIYGAPRVGDAEFLKLLEGRPVWRMENAQDPVPLVPPDIPAIAFNFSDLGTLKFLAADGAVLDRRAVFVLENHKARYQEAKATLDARIKSIGQSGSSKKRGSAAVKGMLDEIGEHIKVTKKEWRTHMEDIFTEIGLSVDQHQPIFYAIKLWNALVAPDGDTSK